MSGILSDIYNPTHLVVDVRSPLEFQRGHVPGAVNIALFTDEERAQVGTAYVKEGREKAIGFGLEFVGPRLSEYIACAHHHMNRTQASDMLMYCWRGGMRSASMAWLFSTANIPVTTIDRGYKSYRTEVFREIEKSRKFVVISGPTGSGKTNVLHALRERGEQVIDFEAIANHKGSAFGALGMPPQPTSEHAMNEIHRELVKLDNSKRIFIEDESQTIGTVALHIPLFTLISNAPRIVLDIPIDERIKSLAADYGSENKEQVLASIEKIGKKLGGTRLKAVVGSYLKGDIETAVELVLSYYDKAYDFSLQQRSETIKCRISSNTGDANKLADRVIEAANKYLA